MWEGGGVHGSHEALLLQAAGSGAGADYGHAGPALLPWLGPTAAPGFSYMAPHHHHQAPPPFGAEAVAAPFGFGSGGYGEGAGAGGVGPHHQLGVFGLDPPHHLPPPPHGLLAAASGGGAGVPQGSRMVSGLLGTLQAELGRMTAKEIMDAKALAASRSHSEAERRRRQRINSHLARLRSLLPNTTKTDKASLLAEVLDHVKELKRQTSAMMVAAAAAASAAGDDDDVGAGPAQQQLLPTEADELAVDAAAVDRAGRLVVRASLCCEDRPDLIPDIVRALAALRMRARRAEITTLGGRVRSVLLITAVEGAAGDQQADGGGDDDDEDRHGRAGSQRRHECIASVQEALRGVMDRRSASSDTSSSGGGGGSIKRQRMNYAAQDQCSV